MRLVPPLKYFSSSCPLMRDTPHKCWEVRVRRLFLSERQLLLLSTALWCKLKISWVLVKRQTIEKGVVLFPFFILLTVLYVYNFSLSFSAMGELGSIYMWTNLFLIFISICAHLHGFDRRPHSIHLMLCGRVFREHD